MPEQHVGRINTSTRGSSSSTTDGVNPVSPERDVPHGAPAPTEQDGGDALGPEGAGVQSPGTQAVSGRVNEVNEVEEGLKRASSEDEVSLFESTATLHKLKLPLSIQLTAATTTSTTDPQPPSDDVHEVTPTPNSPAPQGLIDPPHPPHPLNPLGLHLLTHPTRGRGVFTPQALPAGTLIEESPVLLLSKQQWEEGNMDGTVLGEYGFCWSNGGMGIGLGIASLFNHSPSPNVNFIRQPLTSTIRFITSRRIQPNEELCICYSADESKLWFTPSGQAAKAKCLGEAAEEAEVGSEEDEDGLVLGMGVGFGMGVAELDLFQDGDEEERANRLRLRAREERKREVLLAQSQAEGGSPSASESGSGSGSGSASVPAPMSAKEFKRARYLDKQASKASLAGADDTGDSCTSDSATRVVGGPSLDGILQPVPVPGRLSRGTAAGSRASSSSPGPEAGRALGPAPGSRTSTPSSLLDLPAYPTLPEGMLSDRELPKPLHSDKPARKKETGPAKLVPDLPWGEDSNSAEQQEQEREQEQRAVIVNADEVVKVLGEIERKEEEEDSATFDVWAVDLVDQKLTRLILDFIKEHCVADVRMRHLKRVANRRTVNGEPDHTLIALTATDMSSLLSLQASLASFHPSLADLVPFSAPVPASPARDPEQLRLKTVLWPVQYAPSPPRALNSSDWTPSRRQWVSAGLNRVLTEALSAKSHGELPVSVFATSPPEPFWPINEAFIPPTPLLRASAHDTRQSRSHPLRHAAFNCIAQIASLRTRPPFSEMQPTRNGADYLLTSLSLFITHEPCVMCAMALLHSRVREVFYIFPRERGGGFESAFGIHARKDLNHRYEVWRYVGGMPEGVREALSIKADIAL